MQAQEQQLLDYPFIGGFRLTISLLLEIYQNLSTKF